VNTLLWRAASRYLLHHRWQLALSVLGVALGVAVVVAIDLANDSAQRAFAHAAQTITGRTTHQLVGGPRGIDETVYRRLRVEMGVRTSAPVVEGYARLPGHAEMRVHLLGVDPFAEAPFRDYAGVDAGRNELPRLIAKAHSVVMTAPTARRLGLRAGDSVVLDSGGSPQRLTLISILELHDSITQQALDNVFIVDIATAQELLSRQGYLSRIDLIIDEDARGAALTQRIRALLPEGVALLAAQSRTLSLTQMTRAFELNLQALSLLALVVGMFLIYNAMTFSVVQRRGLFGALRALGVTRRELFVLIMVEAVVIGTAGIILGVVLGVLLSQGLLQIVVRTINDLYYNLVVQDFSLSALPLLKGALLGIGATVLVALVPAIEATSTPPRAVLTRSHIETRLRTRLPWFTAVGVALTLVGAVVMNWPSKDLVLSYTGIFLFICGYALLIPAATVALTHLLRPLAAQLFGLMGRMAVRGVVVSLSRTGSAIAALAVAVAVTIGVGIMIDSFRHSVDHWLSNILPADIYVRAADSTGIDLKPSVIHRLATTPGVAEVSSGKHIYIQGERGITELFVLQPVARSLAAVQFKQGNPGQIWPAFLEAGAAIVSESYAFRHDIELGSSIVLRSDRGSQAFPVAGIYYDYGSDQGVVTISRQSYARFWDDAGIGSMGLYLEPGVDREALMETLRESLESEQSLLIRSNRTIQEAALDIFDRTFTITEILRLLAILVAFVGILSALTAMQLERVRELAVLRCIGLTPRQLWGLVIAECGLTGLAAGLFAIPLGWALGYVLIQVINPRAFGWTLALTVDASLFAQAVVLAIIAALLAGLYPAWRMARAQPAGVLRGE